MEEGNVSQDGGEARDFSQLVWASLGILVWDRGRLGPY